MCMPWLILVIILKVNSNIENTILEVNWYEKNKIGTYRVRNS